MNNNNLIVSRMPLLNLVLVSVLLLVTSSASARTLIFQSSNTEAGNPSASTPMTAVASSVSQNPSANVASMNNSVSAGSELFFMLEQLQQEVNTLRGIIEEQGHELRMLKQSSRDRYLDIDNRVLDLTKRVSDITKSGVPAAIVSGQVSDLSVKAPASNNNMAASTASKAVVRSPASKDAVSPVAGTKREATKMENEAYNNAYNLIMEKKFDDAILALFAYTENFPDSPLLPNVYYWLGEVYLATEKLEQAKTSFSLVMTAYPDSPKVADSLYKLAVTLDRLGQKEQAKQYLAQVQKQYPASSAAKLATSYSLTP
jgi:tol-pal system protein YbgF